MNKKKKIIIILVVLLVIAALIAGGVIFFLWHQRNSLTADVETVEMLNWGYWGDEMSSSGMVTNDYNQDVYLISNQTIQDVFVEEGQEVKAGDQLMAYDMSLTDLQLEMKELEIQNIDNNIILSQRELEKLKKEKPISDTPVMPVEPEPEPNPQPEPELPQLTENGHYNYVTASVLELLGAAGNVTGGTGTEEDPYVILCAAGCYVKGDFFNALAALENPVFVSLRIVNPQTGLTEGMPFWNMGSPSFQSTGMTYNEEERWSVETKQLLADEPIIDDPIIDDPMPDAPIMDEPVTGHTAAELARLIKEEQKKQKDLDLQKRKAELELEQMRKLTSEGVVLAEVDGVVKTVGDKENPSQDGSAFITVSGSEGLYVTGYLSELQLGSVGVGTEIFANSWQSGNSFNATIQSISPYPSTSANVWGEGNPNVSYYAYTAYIENSEGLQNGEYVDLSMTATYGDNSVSSIYLQKAYVREENGRSYVLKADENNRLVKQYVETGKTVYGEAVEIKSGLSMEDRIAFPYGKSAKEGVKVNEASDSGKMY